MGVLRSTTTMLEDVLLCDAKDALEDAENIALGVWVFFPP